MQCLNFFQPVNLNGLFLKFFNKYNENSSKVCFLEVDFEYPKESLALHNHYSLAPDKIEIKKQILSKY